MRPSFKEALIREVLRHNSNQMTRSELSDMNEDKLQAHLTKLNIKV